MGAKGKTCPMTKEPNQRRALPRPSGSSSPLWWDRGQCKPRQEDEPHRKAKVGEIEPLPRQAGPDGRLLEEFRLFARALTREMHSGENGQSRARDVQIRKSSRCQPRGQCLGRLSGPLSRGRAACGRGRRRTLSCKYRGGACSRYVLGVSA